MTTNKQTMQHAHFAKVLLGGHEGIAFQWWNAEQQLLVKGDATQLIEHLGEISALNLIVPAEYCVIKEYQYDASEAKVLRQTLPYSLEDELLSDVDELHFSLGEAKEGKVSVAIVAKELIEQCIDSINNAKAGVGCHVQKIVPELMLLPWLDSQWTLCVDDYSGDNSSADETRYLLRSAANNGFAVPEALLEKALQLILQEQGLPSSVVLYCPENLRDSVKAKLPPELAALVLWQSADYWPLITDESQPGERLNIMQAAFAISLPWRKWWQQWKTVAIILAAFCVIKIAYAYSHNYQLENKNVALRTAVEQAYRTAVPKGAVFDPEQQLRKKVSAMQGGGGEGFVTLLSKIAAVTATVEGFTVQSMNYSEKQSEVRLTVLANSFKDVEAVRSGLQRKGVKAELTGSSSEGGKTRARLRIRG